MLIFQQIPAPVKCRAVFWRGDAAWALFHRRTLAEARAYLDDRARNGLTVVQAVVPAECGGLTVPNAYGHLSLDGGDRARPNEPYLRHVDAVLDAAPGR